MTVLYVRKSITIAFLAAIAVSAACAKPSLVWNGGPLPAQITPEWYLANFVACSDPCPERETRESELWRQVRDRADLLDALITIIEDRRTDDFVGRNTILVLGATNQERAYRYIVQRLGRIPFSDPDEAANWVLSLGSGYRALPDFAYDVLEEQLKHRSRYHPASQVLSDMVGTMRARLILGEAIQNSTADTRRILELALANLKPRPERE